MLIYDRLAAGALELIDSLQLFANPNAMMLVRGGRNLATRSSQDDAIAVLQTPESRAPLGSVSRCPGRSGCSRVGGHSCGSRLRERRYLAPASR